MSGQGRVSLRERQVSAGGAKKHDVFESVSEVNLQVRGVMPILKYHNTMQCFEFGGF